MGLVNTAKALPECPDSATFFSFFPPVPALKGSKGGFCYLLRLKFASLLLRPPPVYNLRSREHTGTHHFLFTRNVISEDNRLPRFSHCYQINQTSCSLLPPKNKHRWMRAPTFQVQGFLFLCGGFFFFSKLKTLLPIFFFLSCVILFFSPFSLVSRVCPH